MYTNNVNKQMHTFIYKIGYPLNVQVFLKILELHMLQRVESITRYLPIAWNNVFNISIHIFTLQITCCFL